MRTCALCWVCLPSICLGARWQLRLSSPPGSTSSKTWLWLGRGVGGWTLCVRFAGRSLRLKRSRKVCAIPWCQRTNAGVLYEPFWASDLSWFGQESGVHGPNTETAEWIRSNFQGGWQQERLSLSKDVGAVLYHVVQVFCACRLCILFLVLLNISYLLWSNLALF